MGSFRKTDVVVGVTWPLHLLLEADVWLSALDFVGKIKLLDDFPGPMRRGDG